MAAPAQMSPLRWAIQLTQMLDKVMGDDRYPVDVEQLILEYSQQVWPDDPVLGIESRPIRGFEGALVPLRDDRRGWLVISNSEATPGRRRFTVAHEVGHYLLHRHRIPLHGIYCKEEDVSHRAGKDIEKEADEFAAALLMPSHDLRRQIDPKAKPTLLELGALAERYGVSLTAAVLRWLEHTERRSVMVVSTEGYALWARSSGLAYRTGRYIKTSGRPYEIPPASGAAQPHLADECRVGIKHAAGVWFDEDVEEHTVHATAFDKVISLLHMGDGMARWQVPDEEQETDVVDRFEALKRIR
ncbi:ImmA/IrrE family metallo-endopeptidase [Methylobacterium sp. J-076]|uniref:ImmA/IrrE family metallo-endopeptidase n=1 Tax=Methylobacterium sp. J-076 TaxID=2836655 RepID=UPI001FB8E39B|nr:ImmA/IrrE family metallo-endopeptidase [Methylobacterium sp. J-076]MCJ2014182.1 ImmA/IrrE family metallo-endopeptidase [Methylobacterium sp. J-076]